MFYKYFQSGLQRTKLNTLITFPLRGLDMSKNVASRSQKGGKTLGSQKQPLQESSATQNWSSWRGSRRKFNLSDNIYDLYAVANHYGNMQGGHYTGK